MTEAQAIFIILKFIFVLMFVVWMVTRLVIFIYQEWSLVKEFVSENKWWIVAWVIFTTVYVII